MTFSSPTRKYDELCVADDIREAFRVFDMVSYPLPKLTSRFQTCPVYLWFPGWWRFYHENWVDICHGEHRAKYVQGWGWGKSRKHLYHKSYKWRCRYFVRYKLDNVIFERDKYWTSIYNWSPQDLLRSHKICWDLTISTEFSQNLLTSHWHLAFAIWH